MLSQTYLTYRRHREHTASRDSWWTIARCSPRCLFQFPTSYILTYLLSYDINIPACTDIYVACATALNTCIDRHRLNASVAQCQRTPVTGVRIQLHALFLLFFSFFLFSLYVRSSLYSAYSVILNHLDFDSRFFVFSTANLSLDLAQRCTLRCRKWKNATGIHASICRSIQGWSVHSRTTSLYIKVLIAMLMYIFLKTSVA